MAGGGRGREEAEAEAVASLVDRPAEAARGADEIGKKSFGGARGVKRGRNHGESIQTGRLLCEV